MVGGPGSGSESASAAEQAVEPRLDLVAAPGRSHEARLGPASEPARGEVLLQELVEEPDLSAGHDVVEDRKGGTGAEDLGRPRMSENVDRGGALDAHLSALARRAAALHSVGQLAEPGEERALLGKLVLVRPLALRELRAVGLGQQLVAREGALVVLQLAERRLAHEPGEQGGAVARDRAGVSDLVGEETRIVRKPEQIELRGALEPLPHPRRVLRHVGLEELADLRRLEPLDAHLRHAERVGRERRAVVQAAAGEDDAAPAPALGQLDEERAPPTDSLPVVVGALVRHLVQRVEEEHHPALAQQSLERGKVGKAALPSLGEPRLGRRARGRHGRVVERHEEGQRRFGSVVARRLVAAQRLDREVQLEAAQHRALAAARGTEEHESRVRHAGQDLAQIVELFGRMPASLGRRLAAVDEERQADEALVELVLRTRPGGQAAEAVLVGVLRKMLQDLVDRRARQRGRPAIRAHRLPEQAVGLGHAHPRTARRHDRDGARPAGFAQVVDRGLQVVGQALLEFVRRDERAHRAAMRSVGIDEGPRAEERLESLRLLAVLRGSRAAVDQGKGPAVPARVLEGVHELPLGARPVPRAVRLHVLLGQRRTHPRPEHEDRHIAFPRAGKAPRDRLLRGQVRPQRRILPFDRLQAQRVAQPGGLVEPPHDVQRAGTFRVDVARRAEEDAEERAGVVHAVGAADAAHGSLPDANGARKAADSVVPPSPRRRHSVSRIASNRRSARPLLESTPFSVP